jgi:AcrR family transcriptional regulator
MPGEPARVGRRRSTTQDHITDVALGLFASQGFDEVSVDDVAQAAGIARRTLFRYYPSKNAIPWGDFDAHLEHMRSLFDARRLEQMHCRLSMVTLPPHALRPYQWLCHSDRYDLDAMRSIQASVLYLFKDATIYQGR